MTAISNNAVSGSATQRAESGNMNAPQAPNHPTQAELVVNAVHISQESAVVAQKLERIAAMEQQIKELLKEHKGIRTSGFPTKAVLRNLDARVVDLRMAILRLQPNVANPEKMHDLKMRMGTLQSQLNDGNLTPLEKGYMELDIAWLDISLERELFMADGGGSEYDFGVRVSRKLGLEAGTLRSALNDGGLSPEDHETMSKRLALLDKLSQQIAASFKSKDVLL